VLASGDMSHCLKPGAPAGYDEQGQIFDDIFVEHIRVADYRGAERINPTLRDQARQDVVESCRVAWHASGFADANHHFYSYEGPFGVGYTVMRFHGED
jgi:aromatic ring-opening dioxygenase LigB subunit